MNTKIDEFIQIVDDIYGLYLDSVNAIEQFRIQFINVQKDASQKLNKSIEELDEKLQTFGKGVPFQGKQLHVCTQGEFKERTKKNGKDSKLIANLCLVMIYSHWEDHSRQEIAKQKGVQKNEITSDIMGDLRYLRESIIHHRGMALPEVKKMKVLKYFNSGKSININEEQFEEIIDKIKEEMIILKNKK